MKIIYLVIIEDRHSDLEVKPFICEHAAIKTAKELAKEYCYDSDDYKEINCDINDNWLFCVNYSCEGDSVRVVKSELNEAVSWDEATKTPKNLTVIATEQI